MVAPRNRATKLQQATLDDQIVDVLGEDHPQSVRHVFYRMTDPRLPEPVEKTEHGYRRVQRRCLALRRNGRIPYGWISDATRRGYHVSTFDGPGDFIRRHRSKCGNSSLHTRAGLSRGTQCSGSGGVQ